MLACENKATGIVDLLIRRQRMQKVIAEPWLNFPHTSDLAPVGASGSRPEGWGIPVRMKTPMWVKEGHHDTDDDDQKESKSSKGQENPAFLPEKDEGAGCVNCGK